MNDELHTETIKVADDAASVALLIWRRFQTRTPGVVERTLTLNPGLADMGLLVPVGAAVTIPIDAPEKTVEQRPVVRLWD